MTDFLSYFFSDSMASEEHENILFPPPRHADNRGMLDRIQQSPRPTPHPTRTKRTKYIGRACAPERIYALIARTEAQFAFICPKDDAEDRDEIGGIRVLPKRQRINGTMEDQNYKTLKTPMSREPSYSPLSATESRFSQAHITAPDQVPNRMPTQPVSEATGSDLSLSLLEETDAYDVYESRPRSISLASHLVSLRELVWSAPLDSIPKIRKYSAHSRIFALELPRPERLTALLEVYFRDLDSFFPFLDRDATENRLLFAVERLGYSECQNIIDVDSDTHSTIALLCSMVAIAECFNPELTQGEDVRPAVDLDIIRYHALSAEYLMQSELLHLAAQAISQATRLAMLVKLNDEATWKGLTNRERDDRRLLWWIIYFLDRKIAQRVGAPYFIRDTEVAVSDFQIITTKSNESRLPSTKISTYRYMQVLIDLAKLWTQIWDSFFAAAAPKPVDWKDIEIMDTRIRIVQQELPGHLTWETESLDPVYLFQGESEPHIRRRLSVYIGASNHEERLSTIESFRLSYQLLVQFSKKLDTAKRAMNALHSAVSPSQGLGFTLKDDHPNPCSVIIGDGELLQESKDKPLDLSNSPPEKADGSFEQGCDMADGLGIPSFYTDAVLADGFHFQETTLGGLGLDSDFWFQFYNNFGTIDTEPPPDIFC
ncbi:hypothetical protein N7474_010298 [Penicillium riverlandense]|uniref:uncharacterized protein n=1 Tax=Penicillium riverlandense TaxID=1903569 RepID=UPI0025480EDD|nr:uncharacterized protein N7474_010298 [Penicillium riverlandense]KAJ5806706.1 hypothetical protein N7474_010298 [Penicillium riverlandense]